MQTHLQLEKWFFGSNKENKLYLALQITRKIYSEPISTPIEGRILKNLT
jgi:hypothetical protein